MTGLAGLIAFVLAATAATGQPPAPSRQEQMKKDLVGQVMGGREMGWKFQSVSQIQGLTIDREKEEPGERVVDVTLRLEDSRVTGVYEAKARLTYKKAGADWKLDAVGLLSMRRAE